MEDIALSLINLLCGTERSSKQTFHYKMTIECLCSAVFSVMFEKLDFLKYFCCITRN
jgi:hypothetical protein